MRVLKTDRKIMLLAVVGFLEDNFLYFIITNHPRPNMIFFF